MKVLVCGSRSWKQADKIAVRLTQLPRGSEIIHGAARGADVTAGSLARSLGIPEQSFPADWRGKGRSAGILRNLEMLDEKPDLVLAFWDGVSTGTKHTIDEAVARGIPVEIIS